MPESITSCVNGENGVINKTYKKKLNKEKKMSEILKLEQSMYHNINRHLINRNFH